MRRTVGLLEWFGKGRVDLSGDEPLVEAGELGEELGSVRALMTVAW